MAARLTKTRTKATKARAISESSSARTKTQNKTKIKKLKPEAMHAPLAPLLTTLVLLVSYGFLHLLDRSI